MVKSSITLNIEKLADRLDFLTKKYQREKTPPLLLAVSKKHSIDAIRVAYQAGLRHFGENYAQELAEKASALADLKDICWHFIGPIQSNKIKLISTYADWVHSVDRSKVLHKLDQYRSNSLPPMNLCIQVNIDAEESKTGITPQDLPSFLATTKTLAHANIRGLMCIPRSTQGIDNQRLPFEKLRALLQENKPQYPQLDTLSMGMSNDIEAAIAEGSTILRVGTTIFGQRRVKPSKST